MPTQAPIPGVDAQHSQVGAWEDGGVVTNAQPVFTQSNRRMVRGGGNEDVDEYEQSIYITSSWRNWAERVKDGLQVSFRPCLALEMQVGSREDGGPNTRPHPRPIWGLTNPRMAKGASHNTHTIKDSRSASRNGEGAGYHSHGFGFRPSLTLQYQVGSYPDGSPAPFFMPNIHPNYAHIRRVRGMNFQSLFELERAWADMHDRESPGDGLRPCLPLLGAEVGSLADGAADPTWDWDKIRRGGGWPRTFPRDLSSIRRQRENVYEGQPYQGFRPTVQLARKVGSVEDGTPNQVEEGKPGEKWRPTRGLGYRNPAAPHVLLTRASYRSSLRDWHQEEQNPQEVGFRPILTL